MKQNCKLTCVCVCVIQASKVPHLRFLYTGITFCELFRVTAEDVIYCSLPFYHSNATVCCFGMNLYCVRFGSVCVKTTFGGLIGRAIGLMRGGPALEP